jgi:hypothetical protein
MILHFGWCPTFSNNLVETRFNEARELQIVCGVRGVLAIAHELSRNIIVHILNELHILDEGPKLHELCVMLNRDW